MPSKTCTICDNTLDISEFAKQRRSCKECNRVKARALGKITDQCLRCKKHIRVQSMMKHQEGRRCISASRNLDNPFNSHSSARVICPCKHPACIVNVAEQTAWRHLSEGQKYWDRNAVHIIYPRDA